MSYGIKIISGNGSLQIDGTDSSHIIYQEYSSGISSTVSGASSASYNSIFVSLSGLSSQNSLIFISPTGSATVSAYLIMGSNGFTIFSDSNVSFRWYAFRKVTDISASSASYGLEIKDSSGNNLINIDKICARIKGTITGNGSITASALKAYSNAPLYYALVTSELSPRRGNIKAWVSEWSSNRREVSVSVKTVSPFGGQVSSEAELDNSFYINTGEPVTLVAVAPDP
jgi:hypothetical protein